MSEINFEPLTVNLSNCSVVSSNIYIDIGIDVDIGLSVALSRLRCLLDKIKATIFKSQFPNCTLDMKHQLL